MKYFKLLLIVAFIASPLVFSCQYGTRFRPDRHYRYLDLSEENQGINDATSFRVVAEAFSRLKVHVEGERLVADITVPEEVNISQKLFDVVISIIESTNNSIFAPTDKPLTKNGDYPMSCVAYALCNCIGGYSFHEINTWITNEYNLNGGVPITRVSEVIGRYWGEDFNAYYSVNYIPQNTSWDVSRTVGIFIAADGYAHMVNIFGYENNFFLVRDYSIDDTTENNTYSIHSRDFLGMYINTSIDTAECIEAALDL